MLRYPYYAFHQPAGTSLICIEGDWSNLVDAQIKGRVAVAMGDDAKSPYSPLYARVVGMPRPWGVTALFAEYTGTQQPLDIDWSLEGGVRTTATLVESIAAEDAPLTAAKSSEPLQQRTADILVEGTELRRLLGTMRFAPCSTVSTGIGASGCCTS